MHLPSIGYLFGRVISTTARWSITAGQETAMDSAELEPELVLHALQLSISQPAIQTDTRLPQAIDREINHIRHRATNPRSVPRTS
jgi:hypothetical protein